jgi:hypothetical protein
MLERENGKTVVINPGLPSRLSASDVETLQTFQRYDTANESKLYRAVNQLARLQRMRLDDKTPRPPAVNGSIQHDVDGVASFGNSAKQTVTQK